MSKTNSKTSAVSYLVPGVVVSVPGAGFFVVGVRGARHPLDRQTFATGSQARDALSALNVAALRTARCA